MAAVLEAPRRPRPPSFTAMPRKGTSTGTQIQNAASIVFDKNAPIVTPTWLNTIDSTNPVSRVSALPSTEATGSFLVQWSGTNVGAGIRDYTIYVSDNGAPFTAWLINTPTPQATYSGTGGHTYNFYSITRDLVRNLENPKTVGDATTTVIVAFATLSAKLQIKAGPPAGFEVTGAFTLGTGSTGINPLTEPVTLQVGTFSTTIMPGSFIRNKQGAFVFQGVINGVTLQFQTTAVSTGSFQFKVDAAGVNLTGLKNPVTLGLTIGDHSGSTPVTAQFK